MIMLGGLLYLASCTTNEDNLKPSPTMSTDSLYIFQDAKTLDKDTVVSKGDVIITADSVKNLTIAFKVKANSEIKQIDIQALNGLDSKSLIVKNSAGNVLPKLPRDMEAWWPNISVNTGFDTPLETTLQITVPYTLMKGEYNFSALIHDANDFRATVTRKITVK